MLKISLHLCGYSMRTFCGFFTYRLAIVYNVFCDTFASGIGVGGNALATLAVAMPIAYLLFCALFWRLSVWMLPGLDVSTRAAALLCSSQKTLAFGIPFIKTAFGEKTHTQWKIKPI